MEPRVVFDAWIGFIGFFVCAWVLWVAWPRLLVDIIRQRLFELRDSLFDAAARGEFRFDDINYIVARNSLNSMIRNAEHATVWRYAQYARIISRHEESHGDLDPPMVSEDAHEIIQAAMQEAIQDYVRLLVFRAPVLAGIAGPVLFARMIARFCQAAWWTPVATLIGTLKRYAVMALQADISADNAKRRQVEAFA